MRYPVKPVAINPFLCVAVEMFKYEPDPPFLGEEAWLVLAQGYPPIIIRYPVKSFVEAELEKIRERCCGEQVMKVKDKVGLSYE
jgi:hypothetical protein